MNEEFRWNEWNLDHIAEHSIFREQVEFLVMEACSPYPENIGQGKWLVRGQDQNGQFLQAIFVIEDDCYYVIHARRLTDREKRRFRRRQP